MAAKAATAAAANVEKIRRCFREPMSTPRSHCGWRDICTADRRRREELIVPTLDPPYHVGMVVADLAAARSRLADLLGVVWGPVLHLDAVDYRDGGGADLVLPSTICYSVGHPSLELIEEVPGTVWVRNEHSNLHHIGIWTEDFEATSAALGSAGCPLQLCGREGDAAPRAFAYHRDDTLGIRVELVDAGMRNAMAFLFEPHP
jgi:catechol 2,3-dioxygenase-like lactoylglutathione lyase family enzyme